MAPITPLTPHSPPLPTEAASASSSSWPSRPLPFDPLAALQRYEATDSIQPASTVIRSDSRRRGAQSRLAMRIREEGQQELHDASERTAAQASAILTRMAHQTDSENASSPLPENPQQALPASMRVVEEAPSWQMFMNSMNAATFQEIGLWNSSNQAGSQSALPASAAASSAAPAPIPFLSAAERENRVRTDPADIEKRLKRELDHARNQMLQEENQKIHFKYEAYPNNFPFTQNHRLDLFEQSGFVKQPLLSVGEYEVGVCCDRGRRDKMEDEHLALFFPLTLQNKTFPIHLFGVFDGHGGGSVSQWAKNNLQSHLTQALIDFNPEGLTVPGIWNALKIACVRLDGEILKMLKKEPGSTATFAMILDGMLWTANIGDSRTVLDNGGEAIQLSEDAKPTMERYLRGIGNRGGYISFKRVMGVLAIARSFGNHNLGRAVSARPKITRLPLAEIAPESHLILACDGIYDVATTQKVVRGVHVNRHKTPDVLARDLAYSAFKAGSLDNLTVLIVRKKTDTSSSSPSEPTSSQAPTPRLSEDEELAIPDDELSNERLTDLHANSGEFEPVAPPYSEEG